MACDMALLRYKSPVNLMSRIKASVKRKMGVKVRVFINRGLIEVNQQKSEDDSK